MTVISLEFHIISNKKDILKRVLEASHLNLSTNIVPDRDKYRMCIYSNSIDGYIVDSLVSQAVNSIKEVIREIPSTMIDRLSFATNFEIVVSDGGKSPIPGVTLPIEYISLAADIGMQTTFNLNITSSTPQGLINSGAYLNIESSDKDIDSSLLSSLAGTEPSIIYKKGEMGLYKTVDFNAWVIEIEADNKLPETPASLLMQKIQNAKAVGIYCQENQLTPVAYITCYSIPSGKISFVLNDSFFSFLKDLSVCFLDLDFMA